LEAEQMEEVEVAAQVPVVRPQDGPPTPTPRPTRTPRPPRIPRPFLLEPRGGARFPDTVRFKFRWIRRLEAGERVSLYIRTLDRSDHFDWWMTETDILNAGGAIREENGYIIYELNSGFGHLPKGIHYWKIAIVLDTPEEKRLVSPYSMERRILRR
jgi:hypothetical protein